MAAGSVTISALRHRPRQAVLVALLSAVVTAAAALGPLYARAVEQSVLRTVVAGAPVSQSSIVVSATGVGPPSPARLVRVVADVVPDQFGVPVGGGETTVLLASSGGSFDSVSTRLTARSRLCRHLTISSGRCVRAPGELVVSRRTAEAVGLGAGMTVQLSSGDPTDGGLEQQARVVGVHEPINSSAPYWGGRAQRPVAAVPVVAADARSQVPTVDDVYTAWGTLRGVPWPELRTHVDLPLRAGSLDLRDLEAVLAATDAVDTIARTVGGSATSSIGALLESVEAKRDQSRTVIPLLAVQLAVLGLVVLAFVCTAATDQRRPEIALARLRGGGARAAMGMLLRELGLPVSAGVALGAGLGWVVGALASRLWLVPGVTLEARPPMWAALAASLLAGLLAIIVAGVPTLRQPLSSLLRRVPPRASALQVGLAEGVVVAGAGAGLVTSVSNGAGPLALLAPGLLAVAGGLLLSQAMIPAGGSAGRAALRAGRLPWALAGLQIGRRPALRRLIAIITVACALLVFAVDAWAVADRNRGVRAAVEAGAPVVLSLDAATPRDLRQSVLDIDPDGTFATPVVHTRSATEGGPRTTAVEPAAFARIARWGGRSNRPSSAALRALRPERVAPVTLPDERFRLAVTASFALEPLPRPPGFEGSIKPFVLAVGVTPPQGEDEYVRLGRLRRGEHTYVADIGCQGCTLSHIFVERFFGDSYPAGFELQVREIRADAAGTAPQVLALGPATPVAWQVVPFQSFPTTARVLPGPPLTILDTESFVSVVVQRGDRPAVSPALATGSLPAPFRDRPSADTELAVAPDLVGGDHLYSVRDTLDLVPRSGPRAVLVDLESAQQVAPGASKQTSYDVWLASDDPTRERRLVQALADDGLQVLSRDSIIDHERAFAREGPTLALRLALLAGLVAVVLAAAVLVVGVATSGASRARDLAALRVVGVPASTLRQASVREHLIVAVLSVLAGAGIGIVAAQMALPEIPLFAEPSTQLPLVLGPAWPAVLTTVVACLALLCLVSVAVGHRLAAAATPGRLREGS